MLMDIRQFLLDTVRQKGVYDDTAVSFVGNGLLDSFEFIELIADLEKKLGISYDLSDFDPDEFTCVDGLLKITVALMK